jgi:tetratricopeptide (TPR) repeat protein
MWKTERFHFVITGEAVMKHLINLILLSLIITSCARYKAHQYPGADEKEYHIDFYSESGEDQLKYAKQFSGEGDYKTAIDLFLKIYENTKTDSTIRQEALLNLGNIYSNVLYAGKDYEKALYYFEKLLNEFPDTEFRVSVIESIDNVKKMMREK